MGEKVELSNFSGQVGPEWPSLCQEMPHVAAHDRNLTALTTRVHFSDVSAWNALCFR